MPIDPSDEEEKYFHAVDVQARRKLRESLEDNARKLEDAAKVAAALATDDVGLAAEIHALGFDGDTAPALEVLPLVHVAWADGKIHRRERATILRVLEARGLGADHAAVKTIAALLDERPSDAFMHESISLLRRLVARGGKPHAIVDQCVSVATAAGSILGLGVKISDEERRLIHEIAELLGPNSSDAIASELG
jgi:uncharacterized tellurite resistance protein B-like protein